MEDHNNLDKERPIMLLSWDQSEENELCSLINNIQSIFNPIEIMDFPDS